MIDELFWILFRPLMFFQTQWFSFFAGILWGYFLRKSGGASRIQLLGLASLLCLQMSCNGILISRMHCGQIFNAGLQTAGGVSLFAIGANDESDSSSSLFAQTSYSFIFPEWCCSFWLANGYDNGIPQRGGFPILFTAVFSPFFDNCNHSIRCAH